MIGGAKAFYEPYFEITEEPFWQGFAMSAALFGCILGAMLSGALSDSLGRRRLLILIGFLFTISAGWTALSGNLTSVSIARLVGGVGIGLASNLAHWLLLALLVGGAVWLLVKGRPAEASPQADEDSA